MGLMVGVLLIIIGLGLLWLGWRSAQSEPESMVATPLGLTGGVVALGGLAVLVSGWDVLGRWAAGVSVVVLIAGLVVTALQRPR